jgi:hypothetical protein
VKLADRAFPSRAADLDFSVRLPSEWRVQDLPPEETDFSKPAAMHPLGIAVAPYAAIVFSAAGRPAYDDGTLQDWTRWLLEQAGLRPSAVGEREVAGVPAQVGMAVQDSDLGPMEVRFAFLEDGNRLLSLTLSAPEAIARPLEEPWQAILDNFRLGHPKGARNAPLKPPVVNDFARHAIAADAVSLDEEHPANASMRNHGIGFVPRVASTDDRLKQATLYCGSLVAQVSIPYGWHIIDDGRRVLVFEPSNEANLHLDRFPREGMSPEAIFDAMERQALKDYPAPKFVRAQTGPRHALGIVKIEIDGRSMEQYQFLAPGPDVDTLLRARLTVVPEMRRLACDLVDLVLDKVLFLDEPRREPPKAPKAPKASAKQRRKAAMAAEAGESQGLPPSVGDSGDGADFREGAWEHGAGAFEEAWKEAECLEAAGRLDEMEARIRGAMQHAGVCLSVAELYVRRIRRLKKAGDDAGARDAHARGGRWAREYPTHATSGGEGTAMSLRRDEMLAALAEALGNGRRD